MFSTKHSIGRISSIHNDACASFNKTSPLISKYFLRIQMKNQSTKNA